MHEKQNPEMPEIPTRPALDEATLAKALGAAETHAPKTGAAQKEAFLKGIRAIMGMPLNDQLKVIAAANEIARVVVKYGKNGVLGLAMCTLAVTK